MVIRGYAVHGRHASWNCKGTNEYANRDTVVYLYNVYPNPGIVNYLQDKGITFDQEGYALSSMLQFIWRSAIRNNEPIKVMIPNQRMRGLLKGWLENIN